MTDEIPSIDVTAIPDLLRIVEEVGRSGEAHVLRKHDKDLAVLVPISTRPLKTRRALSTQDREAFLSAAGGWSDVDTDRLLEDIYESRSVSDRPPVDL